MEKIAVLASVIILLQLILSLYQVRYYNRFIKKLTKKYEGSHGYRLRTEVAKKYYSSVVIVVVLDEQHRIVECFSYSGLTIFSKFKIYDKYVGEKIDNHLLNIIKGEKPGLKSTAFETLICKEMETVTR
ncbi:glucitol operon activator protein GutM [Trichococcus patagoniensis]|uniref:Glucitol operon activator protein GutM n=1 Tax=Trichococcus patagoniensis TaxID=382641 RepID=A0A2T5IJG7_9LACT|nr:transcriptional regulator GutM [Trichococcus patagoniensis]PTQ83968.1 glucitol operon activator protein GutM [Trichococcus patagoniensis]